MSKKIMFSDKYGLTQAVLNGGKTQTRRVIKLKDGESVKVVALDNGCFMSYVAKDGNPTAYTGAIEMPNFVQPLEPKYFIGEVVAVAQSYTDVIQEAFDKGHKDLYFNAKDIMGAGCNNKMFVKAELMPHHIRITDIRIERLQDISDDDCLKEGVERCCHCNNDGYVVLHCGYCYNTPREAYTALIDKVSGKGTWDSNPYVFVYEFELVD